MIFLGVIAILVGFFCILEAILDYGRHIGFEAKFKVAQKHFSNSMV